MTSPRFEVVHTKAGFHARFITANGRTQWWTESYNRRRNAVAAIELICGAPVLTSPFADHPEVMWAGISQPTEVRDIDERPEPPAPPTIEPPYWLGHRTEITGEGRAATATRVPFWHDHQWHYRQCYGDDECRQGTPPNGTNVRGRLGTVNYQEKS